MAAKDLQQTILTHFRIELPVEFPDLFKIYLNRLCRYDRETVSNDLEALVFIECDSERHNPQLSEEGSSECLFSRTTTKRILERITQRIRRQERREHRSLPADMEPAIEPPRDSVQDLLESLSPDQRTVVFLYYIENHGIKEIGRLTGTSTTTAFRTLKAALKRLKEGPE